MVLKYGKRKITGKPEGKSKRQEDKWHQYKLSQNPSGLWPLSLISVMFQKLRMKINEERAERVK